MKPSGRLLLLVLPVLLVLLFIVILARTPLHPVALIRVVDETGVPVAGAVVRPDGLRTKRGPYFSNGYGWRGGTNGGVANVPVTTDKEGYARVPYPKYVFERIETGTLSVSVQHQDFVPNRSERVVATAPPTGAPWRVRVDDLLNRIRRKALIARPDPIVLKQGATLVLEADALGKGGGLFAQISGSAREDTNFWIRPRPGVLMTRRLAAGSHAVRVVGFDADGTPWFSDVIAFTTRAGETNELAMHFERGARVSGKLDPTVPRPVRNGRVVANVWPNGHKPEDSPPQWHGWAVVNDDGTFSIPSLPTGDLEVVALCDGFVSTNGPGKFQMRYPQKHLLSTNDLTITIGMEPTARVEVRVVDDRGNPLKDVRVLAWPNVRYGEWVATILMGDCYNTADRLLAAAENKFSRELSVPDFEGLSDAAGLAVLPNVPATAKQLAAQHPRFTLPAIETPDSQKRREVSLSLIAAQTNHLFIQLEPRERSTITHY
jgi:hypothetical protein